MDIRRLPIVAGLSFVSPRACCGRGWRLGLERLPGDIAIQRQNFSFYFPVVACLVIGVTLMLLFWLFRK